MQDAAPHIAAIKKAIATLHARSANAAAPAELAALRTCPPEVLDGVLRGLHVQLTPPGDQPAPPLPGGDLLCPPGALAIVAEQIWRRYPPQGHRAPPLSASAVESLARLYEQTPTTTPASHQLLRALSADAGEHALREFARLIVARSPDNAQACDLALVPLFQNPSYSAAVVFPKLLEGLDRPTLAVAVLDLANYLTRTGRARPHPAASILERLLDLFARLAQQLARVEENPQAFGDVRAIGHMVNESAGLLVAMCDALALIGDPRAIGKLRLAQDLAHRRLRVEAAAALVRLGYTDAKANLLELAKAPVVRNRVLAYATELGLAHEVPAEFQSAAARAEGDVAAWLAAPWHIGRAPDQLQVIDQRTMRWPGHEDPVDCCLVRYEYALPQGKLRGVGIAGPSVHCWNADLNALAVEDIYAAYAGHDAKHAGIRERAPGELDAAMRQRADACLLALRRDGYTQLRLALVGEFLGAEFVVASALREDSGQRGIVIARADARGDEQAEWFPAAEWPLDADEVYDIFKGRRLLAAFNPPA